MDRHSGKKIHIERWVIAETPGRIAARNKVGEKEPFGAVPSLWSAHYDTQMLYDAGHVEVWDRLQSMRAELELGAAGAAD